MPNQVYCLQIENNSVPATSSLKYMCAFTIGSEIDNINISVKAVIHFVLENTNCSLFDLGLIVSFEKAVYHSQNLDSEGDQIWHNSHSRAWDRAKYETFHGNSSLGLEFTRMLSQYFPN